MSVTGINNQLMSEYINSGQNKNINKQLENVMNTAKAANDDEALKKACQEFESYFMNIMLKEMKKTVPDGGLTEKSHARTVFEDMLYEEYANESSKGQGFGLADSLYKQLSRQTAVVRNKINDVE